MSTRQTSSPLLKSILFTITYLALATRPAPAAAQPAAGGIASIAGSIVFDEAADGAVTGAVGYRLTPAFAVTLEFTSVPDLTPELPGQPEVIPAIFPPPIFEFSAEGGHGTFVTGNLRLELPARAGLRPFLLAGGGAGTVVERVRRRVTYPPQILAAAADLAPPGLDRLPGRPFSLVAPSFDEVVERSSTGFAATIGGGIGIGLNETLSIDVDVRYLALLGRADRHLARVGAGLTARF